MTIQKMVWQGFEAITLENTHIRIISLPTLGNKVVSLFDKNLAYEWLAQPTQPDTLRPATPDADFSAYTSCGWDECFPNIQSGTHPVSSWNALALPDHGELWSRAWTYQLKAEQLTTVIKGYRFPYTFERSLRLQDNSLLIDYRVTNHSDQNFACMWALHPLFHVESGMQIKLPASVNKLRIDSSTDSNLGASGDWLTWPLATNKTGQTLDLAHVMSSDQKLALKLYTPLLEQGWAALTSATHWLALRFDPKIIPFVGLWLNYGGWPSVQNGLYHAALEPCTAIADDLTKALQAGSKLVIPANQTINWQVTLAIGSQSDQLEKFIL